MHSRLDLNLLVALDALLEEGSVAGAAARLHLSGPAMSRTLGRIRKALGDPVLVRSGRAMVPTPRAQAMRAEVHELVQRVHTLFAEDSELDPGSLDRSFTLQAEEGTVAVLAAPLLARLHTEAPGVAVRFLAEGPQDSYALRRDVVDLEIGVIATDVPEARVEPLMEDRIVGVVRPSHPLAEGEVTLARFTGAAQLISSRRGRQRGPVDELLAGLGLRRKVSGSVPTTTAALHTVLHKELVGFAAERLHRPLIRQLGLRTFPIPLALPPLRLSLGWHPRYDADLVHRWLRDRVRQAIAEVVVIRPGSVP